MSDEELSEPYDPEMERILQEMLDRDDDITARGVIRLYPSLRAPSSITRNPFRSQILSQYKAKQDEFREWRKRLAKRARDSSMLDLVEKDIRIQELERQVELLRVSHVAMLRAVGELGGFAKWAKFYENYREVRNDIAAMGAMPEVKELEMPIRSRGGRPQTGNKKEAAK